MSNTKNKRMDTRMLAMMGILTAIVAVIQYLTTGMRLFGMFSVTFALVPIVVGAALCGWKAGAWLGLVFGVVVLFTDSALFLEINAPGTIVTVLLKGALAGAAAGEVYRLIEKKNRWAAVITAAVVCPVVNTGIFLLGCLLFFLDTVSQWAAGFGYESAGAYMIFGLTGINFLVEVGVNLVLSTAIVRILDIVKKPAGRPGSQSHPQS